MTFPFARQRAGTLGIGWDDSISSTREAVAFLMGAGMTDASLMAHVIGRITDQAVRYHMRKIDPSTAPYARTPEWREARGEAVLRHRQDKSFAQIGQMAGLTRERMQQIAAKALRLRARREKVAAAEEARDAQALEGLAGAPLCRAALARLLR